MVVNTEAYAKCAAVAETAVKCYFAAVDAYSTA